MLRYYQRVRNFHNVVKQMLHSQLEDILETADIQNREDLRKQVENLLFRLMCRMRAFGN